MILYTYISYVWYYRYTHIQSCHSIERADFGLPPSWSGSLGWDGAAKDIPNNRQKTLKQSQAVSVPDLTMRSAVIEIFGCFEAWNYSLASRPALLLGWVLELIVWELNCEQRPQFSSANVQLKAKSKKQAGQNILLPFYFWHSFWMTRTDCQQNVPMNVWSPEIKLCQCWC